MKHPRALKPEAASKYLGGVSVSTLARWADDGLVTRFRRGRVTLYDRASLDALFDETVNTVNTDEPVDPISEMIEQAARQA